jgi:hypothetical protein
MIHTIEPQTGTATGPSRPSRSWYLVAGALLAAAAACLTIAVAGMLSWDRQIQDFQRVPVPGHGTVTLTQPGGYVLYVETRGRCCAWSVGSQDTPPSSGHQADRPATRSFLRDLSEDGFRGRGRR